VNLFVCGFLLIHLDHIQVNISSANTNVQVATFEIKEADKIQSGTNNKLCILAIVCTLIILAVVGGLSAYFVLKDRAKS
jgi:hypothetical protein